MKEEKDILNRDVEIPEVVFEKSRCGAESDSGKYRIRNKSNQKSNSYTRKNPSCAGGCQWHVRY